MAAQAAVHTSAQALCAAYEGVLLRRAEVRTMLLDGATSVPVVCMDVELDNQLHTRMVARQPFGAGEYNQAHKLAATLKKGTRIEVQAPLVGVQLVLPNVTRISPLPQQPAAPAAATPSTTHTQEPELWQA